jgi:hypothetical protein
MQVLIARFVLLDKIQVLAMVDAQTSSFFQRVLLWILVSVAAAAMSLQFATARPLQRTDAPGEKASIAHAQTESSDRAMAPSALLAEPSVGVHGSIVERSFRMRPRMLLPMMAPYAPLGVSMETETLERSVTLAPSVTLATPPPRSTIFAFKKGRGLSIGGAVRSDAEAIEQSGRTQATPEISTGVILFSMGL